MRHLIVAVSGLIAMFSCLVLCGMNSQMDELESGLEDSETNGRQLLFPKYVYTRSSQIENRLKTLANSCSTKTECLHMRGGADRQNCVLKCISSKCYERIYEFDPLEDGEIDQRYNSFKGCFVSERG